MAEEVVQIVLGDRRGEQPGAWRGEVERGVRREPLGKAVAQAGNGAPAEDVAI